MKIFNAKTQQEEEVTFTVDANQELVASFPDGHFLKFPAGSTKADIEDYVAKHRESNEGQEVITPEMEEQAAAEREKAEALVNELNGNTMPEGDKTNATSEEDQG